MGSQDKRQTNRIKYGIIQNRNQNKHKTNRIQYDIIQNGKPEQTSKPTEYNTILYKIGSQNKRQTNRLQYDIIQNGKPEQTSNQQNTIRYHTKWQARTNVKPTEYNTVSYKTGTRTNIKPTQYNTISYKMGSQNKRQNQQNTIWYHTKWEARTNVKTIRIQYGIKQNGKPEQTS